MSTKLDISSAQLTFDVSIVPLQGPIICLTASMFNATLITIGINSWKNFLDPKPTKKSRSSSLSMFNAKAIISSSVSGLPKSIASPNTAKINGSSSAQSINLALSL